MNNDKHSGLTHNSLTGIVLFAGVLCFAYGLVGGDAYLIAGAIFSSGAVIGLEVRDAAGR